MADLYANLGSSYRLHLWVAEQSQNIAANQTTVVWSVEIQEINTATKAWNSFTSNAWSVTIDGQVFSGTTGYDFRNYDALTLGSGTKVVNHNADGTKTIGVSASWNDTPNTIPDGSLSGNVGLATIARASQPRLSQSHTNAGSAVTVYTDRASTSFTHHLQIFFGTIGTTVATGVTDSTTYTIPLNWLEQMPNTDRMFGTIRLVTFSGSTQIGYKDVSFAVTTPSTAIPTIATVTATEATAGVAANVGKLVQGVSTLTVGMTGEAGVHGSTIVSRKFEVAGQTVNGASGTTGPLGASGNLNVVATVTDSRGKVGTKTLPISVLGWAPPTITNGQVFRSTSGGVAEEDGSNITVKFTGAISSLMNGTEKNARLYQIRTRKRGTEAWDIKQVFVTAAGTSSLITRTFAGYGPEDAFEVMIDVKDDFATSSLMQTVSVAQVFMHWDGSDGMGLGKYRENGMLDVAGDGFFSGSVVSRNWGEVANYAALPATGNRIGDQRLALDTGCIFMWNGSAWKITQSGTVPYLRAVSGDITQSNTSTGDINYTSANLRGGFTRSGNTFVVPPGCGGIYSLNATARSFNQSLNVFIRLYVNGVMIANITSGGQEGIHISHVYEVAEGATLSVRIFPYTGSTGIGDLLFSATRIGG